MIEEEAPDPTFSGQERAHRGLGPFPGPIGANDASYEVYDLAECDLGNFLYSSIIFLNIWSERHSRTRAAELAATGSQRPVRFAAAAVGSTRRFIDLRRRNRCPASRDQVLGWLAICRPLRREIPSVHGIVLLPALPRGLAATTMATSQRASTRPRRRPWPRGRVTAAPALLFLVRSRRANRQIRDSCTIGITRN